MRSFRRLLLHPATVGFIAGLAVIGLWRLTSGITGTADPEEESTVPTVLIEPDESTDLSGTWTRVDLPGRSRLTNVWEVGGTLYAAGWDSAARRTVVWFSPDGGVWRPAEVADGSFDAAAVYDMVGFNGLVLAVGARQIEEHPVLDQIAVPAVWASADGEVFQSVADLTVANWVPEGEDPAAFVGGGFTSVLSVGESLLVGGWEGSGDLLSGRGETRPGLWTTQTGLDFSRVADGLGPVAELSGVVRTLTTDGTSLVAAGTFDGSATIWTSQDGSAWDRVVADGGDGSAAIAATPMQDGALILGQGVVGEGETVTDAIRFWAPSGGNYRQVAALGIDDGVVADVAAGGVGVVAVGSVAFGEGTAAAVWSSDDAQNWERVQIDPAPRQSEIRSIVVGEMAVVAVGEVHDQPSIWILPLDETQDVSAGVGSLFVPPAWSTVFQQIDANDSVPTTVFRAGEFLYGVSPSRWIWRSDDGDVWTLADFASIGLGDATDLSQVVASEVGWAAVGTGEGGSLWFSADGENWGRPTLAPPCCAVALFRDQPGFRALVRDATTEAWVTATTSDGLVWDVAPGPIDVPVATVDFVASMGRLGLVWGDPVDSPNTVFGSIDGEFWFPIVGPNDVFPSVEWRQVWDLGDEIVAAGTIGTDPVLYRLLEGGEWQELELPALGAESLVVRDVGGFGEGLAVLVSYDDRPSRLLTFSGVGAQAEVPLDVASGFTGLWSILVPNDEGLRMAGPDHGRMTIWEWIPAPPAQ